MKPALFLKECTEGLLADADWLGGLGFNIRLFTGRNTLERCLFDRLRGLSRIIDLMLQGWYLFRPKLIVTVSNPDTTELGLAGEVQTQEAR